MINIDNLEKFVIEELAQGEHFSLRKEGWIDLLTRLRQAEKDAARYRWLRDKAHTVTGVTPCAFVMKDGDLMEDLNGHRGLLCMGALDYAIDEAVRENKA